jgi:hypothetical protein
MEQIEITNYETTLGAVIGSGAPWTRSHLVLAIVGHLSQLEASPPTRPGSKLVRNASQCVTCRDISLPFL